MTGLEKSRQVWTNFDISLMQKLVHKMQYFQSVFSKSDILLEF